MALIEKDITIEKGRDKGKVFRLTEMPARPAHKWATRVIFAAFNNGGNIPADLLDAGMSGIAAIGVQAIMNVPYEQAEPLLDQLIDDCVRIVPDPGKPSVLRRLVESDVEDATTYFRLQKEVLTMHVEPFISGSESTSASSLPVKTAAS